MNTRPWYSHRSFLGQLDPAEQEMIKGSCHLKTFQKRDFIYEPEAAAKRVYILEQGSVVRYKLSGQGKKVILAVHNPVTVFGNLSFSHETAQDHYAQALTTAEVCMVPKEDFMQIIHRRPEMALTLLDITNERLQEAESRIRDMAITDAKSRVVNQLLRLAEKTPTEGDPSKHVVQTRLTHETLAYMVGLTRETTTKILNDLEREGIITCGAKHSITIHSSTHPLLVP